MQKVIFYPSNKTEQRTIKLFTKGKIIAIIRVSEQEFYEVRWKNKSKAIVHPSTDLLAYNSYLEVIYLRFRFWFSKLIEKLNSKKK